MTKIAVIQMTSGLEFQENLEKIRSLLSKVKEEKVQYVFLPECFYSMSDGTKPSPYLINGNDEHYQNIKQLAMDFEVYLLGGSAASYGGGEVVNRAYNFDPKGRDLGQYDKMHLFSCNLGEKKVINESDIYASGDDYKLIQAGEFKIGLGICFDLRFSEMALHYTQKGAQILTYASAFTVPTGKAHWHTLLRARAIETQSFVVASAQWGRNNDRIQTYGHSLVVNPWGEVLLDMEEGEGVSFAEINLNEIEEVRAKVLMRRS